MAARTPKTTAKRTSARKTTTTRKPTTTRTPKPEPVAPSVGPGERLYVLAVPFNERSIASTNGARWDPYHRQTIYIGKTLPHSLTRYASPDYSWERWVEDEANGRVIPATPPTVRFTPRPHQQVAINKIEATAVRGYRGFVEADDVGLGKTIASWAGALRVAAHRDARTVLVVCPKGVIPHWRRTIAAVGDGGLRVVVINYDQSKKLLSVPESAASATRTRTKNKRITAAGQPLVNWDIVILDESHKIKNQDAQRTRAISRIARYAAAAKSAPFVIWASATAGQNPVEIGYLAPLLSQLTGTPKSGLKDFGQWLADQGFAVTYNTRFKKWDWGVLPENATISQTVAVESAKERDLERIRVLLFDGPDAPSIRRLPTDIAGWPQIQRILHPVTLTDDEQRLYDTAWTQFRRDMRLVTHGHDPKGGLAARLRFQQKSSLIRVPGTVDLISDLVDNGHQVAVSVEFHETTDGLIDALNAARVPVAEYTGRNEATREAERLAFQRGERKVIVFSVPEGISLHAKETLPDGTLASDSPRTTVVHDPRYSGIESLQIEGRCHRDGQNAKVYYAFAARTVEGSIVKTLIGRIRSTKTMAGDDVSTVRALEGMLDQMATGAPMPETDSEPAPTLALVPDAVTITTPTATPALVSARSGESNPGARKPNPAKIPCVPIDSGTPTAPASRARRARTTARGRSQAGTDRDRALSPEEEAFRDALAGGKARPLKRTDLAAERAEFKERLRKG